MDSQKQQSAECAVCGNAAFDLLDGLYFCSDCGTQSQDVREEVTDATGEAGQSVIYKRLLKSSTKKIGTAGSASVKEDGASLSQLEIFQLILQKQCDAMVAMGVDPSIKEAVRLIWFHYLRFYGYAFTDSLTKTPGRKRKILPPSVLEERLETGRCDDGDEKRGGLDEAGGGRGGGTPKGRKSIGRPRKKFSDLLSKFARRRRINEAAKGGADLVNEGLGSWRDAEKTNGGSRKRPREEDEESTNGRTKRIKSEKEEENTFDTFPNDEHLFDASQGAVDAESADSAEDEEGESGESDSDEELRGVELYLQRRRETQLVTGNTMLAYFSLKYTICLCYLGLLYIKHNLLLSDLVRWTLLNKLPYNNLASILPRSITTDTNFQAYVAIIPLASNRVYCLSRALHSHLNLPPLPPLHPAPICHVIIDRLKLSPCFHTLIDRVLASIHSPSSEECFRFSHRRFDEDCLSVVLVLVRLIYKLDDVYEFEQSRLTTPAVSTPSQPSPVTCGQPSSSVSVHTTLSDGLSVYPWEDWVVIYLREMHQRFDKEIPTSQRELEYVLNYRKYVDFCRFEIFQATRPPPMDWFRRAVYNPDYYAKLSEIFRRYHTKVEQGSKVKLKSEYGPNSYEDVPDISGTNEEEPLPSFTPRQISLSQLLSDPQAPWRDYRPLREQTESFVGVRHRHLVGIDLSHSLAFLVNVGACLLDVQPEDLHEALMRAEKSYLEVVMKAFKKIGLLIENTA